MNYYQLLQCDPIILKRMIKNKEDSKLKLISAMVLRSLLIVLFAVVFISLSNMLFGNENSPMAVSIFVLLLGFRQITLGYNYQDSVKAIALILLILTFVPNLVNHQLAFLVHAIAFFLILILANNVYSLAGLFTFSYIYIVSNPVSADLLVKRLLLALSGIVILSIVLYRNKNSRVNISYQEVLKETFKTKKIDYILKLSVGMGLVLGFLSLMKVERGMWAAFAALSLFTTTNSIVKHSFSRILGAILGSLIFFVLYNIIPTEAHMLLGLVGGFVLGLSTSYVVKTACNCIGAIYIAVSIYGAHPAISLRVFNTFIGLVFAIVVYLAYHHLVSKRLFAKLN